MTSAPEATVTVSAENQWTDWIEMVKNETRALSISDVTNSTVTLQRRLDGTTAVAVDTWTVDAEEDYYASARQAIRLGVATGDYGTDSPQLEIRD